MPIQIKNYSLLLILLIAKPIYAQTIPVNSQSQTEEQQRNAQLLGMANPNISFTLRPLTQPDTSQQQTSKIKLHLLPLSLTQQYNTQGPYGLNDGPLIPAKGYQTLFSAGISAQYKHLSIQLKPEWVYAANPTYQTFPLNETDAARLAHISYLNTTDLPEPFGNKTYQHLGWGQSNITYNTPAIAIGLSTENLWWGPGTRNALIMSNSAPGFLHLSLNTRKPIKTRIGSFEAQLIAGKLESSNYSPAADEFIVNGINYQTPKPNNWRYLSGLSLNYHPKWVPGLFVGINRVIQLYHQDIGKNLTDYLPVILPLQKKNVNGEDTKKRDQLASIFLRWAFLPSKSEIYLEYGWNDYAQNFWDLFESPEHSRAYLAGFRKLFIINPLKATYLKLNIETTQLQQSADRLVRPAGAWYQHGTVLQGYTNKGQAIGAGIGPGSNLQTIDISIHKQNQVLGFQLERYAHNLDFYYDAYTTYDHKWVDLILNTYTYRQYGKLGLQARIGAAWMRNYQWQAGNHKLNMQFQTTLTYHLGQ